MFQIFERGEASISITAFMGAVSWPSTSYIATGIVIFK